MRGKRGHGVAGRNKTIEGVRFGKVQCCLHVDASAAYVRFMLGLG